MASDQDVVAALVAAIDVAALAREIARELAARMDPDALLDAADVGALLGFSARSVTERFVLAPGFPKALRLTGPGDTRAHPRWKRSAVMAWVDAHENGASKRGGRPRNRVE